MNAKVAVVGPFPPPVHGMAKNTKIVADELELHVDVLRCDISPGSLIRGWSYHKRKGALVVKALFQLASKRGLKCLYIPSDAGLGMVYTALFLVVARIRGVSVFVHHRSFAYIDTPSALMRLIVGIGGAGAQHIFLCGTMRSEFERLYGERFGGRVVSNAQHVHPISDAEVRSAGGEFVIGHLSNLSREKGLFEVLEVFEALKAEGMDCKLILAGPAASEEAESAIKKALDLYGASVEHRGPVWGDEKDAFYRAIDVFLFPTKYKNEAQPNVVFEALAYATPVVAYGRGCVRVDLNVGGLVVNDGGDFVNEAKDFILAGHRDRAFFAELRMDALKAVRSARDGAIAGYQAFINDVVKAAR